MLEVIKPGLETTVQDWPGRIGYWEQGFPFSGPMDDWSFRLANLLVDNSPDAAGLECQFTGPTLRFGRDAVVAVTGADMQPTLDNAPVPMWESFAVRAGQVLTLGFARLGARAYLAVAGGIDTTPVLGSRATFHKAGIGGLDGYALKAEQSLPLGDGAGRPGRRVRPEWTVQTRSNRTGFRLDGPAWSFAAKATDKRPEHGEDPSNILDHGYPVGAVNLCGQTPIILVNDGPSTGGFINPYTVPSAAFWKLAQSKPGDTYRFRAISVDEAQDKRRAINRLIAEPSIETV